jgi:hypothetical protein
MAGDHLDALLRGLADAPAAAVEIVDGTEHFRGGAVRLVLHGSGAAEVEQRVDGEARRFSARLSHDRVAQVGARLADLGFASLEPPQRRLRGGETLVRIVLRDGENELRRRELPSGDRPDDARLDGILDCYEELLGEITDGALPPKAGG